MSNFDKKEIEDSYFDVRNDNTNTTWVAWTYDGKNIVEVGKGEDNEDLRKLMIDNDDRVYAYAVYTTGDEMSVRKKFVFMAFLGSKVAPMAKARCYADRCTMKTICQNFATEMLFDGQPDTTEEIVARLRKAGGANYDAQS